MLSHLHQSPPVTKVLLRQIEEIDVVTKDFHWLDSMFIAEQYQIK